MQADSCFCFLSTDKMLQVLRFLLIFFTVSGLSFAFHPFSTRDGKPLQKKPEMQISAREAIENMSTKGSLSRNQENGTDDGQTPKRAPVSIISQKDRTEKSTLSDSRDEDGVKLSRMKRLKQEKVEEESREKLVAGVYLHHTREDTEADENMPKAKQEVRKGEKEDNKLKAAKQEDIKNANQKEDHKLMGLSTLFDQSEILVSTQTTTQLQNPPSSPLLINRNVLPSPPGVSMGGPPHANIKLRKAQVQTRLHSEDGMAEPTNVFDDEVKEGEVISTLQAAEPKPAEGRFIIRDLATKEPNPPQKPTENIINTKKMVTLSKEPNAEPTPAEPRSVQQMENDTTNPIEQNKIFPQQPQATKTSADPRLTTATAPSPGPRKTNKGSKNRTRKKQKKQTTDNKTRKPQKEKKKNTPVYFPYFKDDYCPPECACYGRVVQCSDKGVQQVPYGIPYNSRYVLLMNNHISSIQLDLLREYESMEFLTLSNNQLTDGSVEGAFEGVPALKRLFLDGNLLQSVPTDLPGSLEELRLDGNHLRVMSETAWTCCPGLLVLSLSNNSFGNGSLPKDVLSPLCKLRTLNLNYNRLTSVPLGLPTSVKELYLKGNYIKEFCGGSFSETSELAVLDLGANRLTNKGLLRDALLNTTHLESLNLEGNKLKHIPRHLPSSLKALNLEGNLILAVKKSTFSTLKHLEHLGLARNKIFKVAPGAFGTLPMLHQLDLGHNALHQVPRQLPQSLHSVALTHNRIQSVPRDAFCWRGRSLSGLVQVQLEHNLINMGNLDARAFRCLRGFQVVHFY